MQDDSPHPAKCPEKQTLVAGNEPCVFVWCSPVVGSSQREWSLQIAVFLNDGRSTVENIGISDLGP